MPRGVLIRSSYVRDAARLTQLAEAVEKDEKQNDLWRREVVNLLKATVVKLCEAKAMPLSRRAAR